MVGEFARAWRTDSLASRLFAAVGLVACLYAQIGLRSKFVTADVYPLVFLLGLSALSLWGFSQGLRVAKASSSQSAASSWKLIAWGVAIGAILRTGSFILQSQVGDSVAGAARTLSLVGLAPIAAGILALAFGSTVVGRARHLMDSGVAALSVTALVWSSVLNRLWQTSDRDFLSRVIAATIPIGAATLIFAALFVLFSTTASHRLKASSRFLSLGALCFAAEALVGSYETLGTASPFFPDHALAMAGVVCVGIATITFQCGGLSRGESPDELYVRSNVWRGIASVLWPYAIATMAFGIMANADLIKFGAVSLAVFLVGAGLMLMVMIRQIVTLIENQRLTRQVAQFNVDLEQIVERRTGQLQALYSLAKNIGNSLDLEGVVNSSIDHALHALNGDAIVLNLTPFALSGYIRLKSFVMHRGLEQDLWLLDKLNILEAPGVGSYGIQHDALFKRHAKYVMAPIVCKSQTLGWIAVVRWNQSFDRSDASLLEGIGSEIGTAMENARLYEMARRMADIDPVTGLVNHRAAQQRFEFAFRHAEDTGEQLSVLMIDIDNFKYFNDTYGHLAGDQVLKTVAKLLRENCRPHYTPARYGGDEFLMVLPGADERISTDIVERILASVASVGYKEPNSERVIPFQLSIGRATFPTDARTRHELMYFADSNMYQIKRSVSTGKQAKRVIRKPASSTGESFDLLDSMVNAVDNKDYYTRAHSEEVTDYAIWIAQELGMSEEALAVVRTSALLHDVGKIGIPDEILRKPGHLTDEEFEVMRQHPVVGAMIVNSIPGLGDILPGVRHHHERWDGKGYPDALAGENIPLLGRLLAVPDAFSAMTTDRPYRKGMRWSEALEKIHAGVGTQFDPTIASAFFRAIEKRRDSLPQLDAA